MTIGERLLSLTVEYQEVTSGVPTGGVSDDEFPTESGRTREEIAKDYEAALRELLAS